MIEFNSNTKKQIIYTQEGNCRECYACLRNCPVKAIKVSDGQAEIIQDRCLSCGRCLHHCYRNVKYSYNFSDEIEELAKSNELIAALAPSFASQEAAPDGKDWPDYLKAKGFSGLIEVGSAADYLVKLYYQFWQEEADRKDFWLSSTCPVVVSWANKYLSVLEDHLIPLPSPMGLLAEIWSASKYKEDYKLVFIGPCHAKKSELSAREDNPPVLTFSELEELDLKASKDFRYIKLIDKDKLLKDREFSMSGGLKRSLINAGFREEKIYTVEGESELNKLFSYLEEGGKLTEKPVLFDLLYCQGCISSIELSSDPLPLKEENLRKNNHLNISDDIDREYLEITSGNYKDYIIKFDEKIETLSEPNEDEIREVLRRTGKEDIEDELNCGACGYPTCYDKARANLKGLAEENMCLPYLLSEKRKEIDIINQNNRQLDFLINSSVDGLAIVDSTGEIIKVNEAYLEMLGQPEEDIVGVNADELQEKRIVYPAISSLTFKEGRDLTIIQQTSNGKKLLTTARPIYNEDDRIERIIVNARDIHSLNLDVGDNKDRKLKLYLSENNGSSEIKEGPGDLIWKSEEMDNIINLSRKIAYSDSSVLIVGESGTGKEVIASYIHDLSDREGNMVKINCAAIPDNLLESELFGYETGAFTGARSEGKKGLIEKADGGTLFLDEIAELPLQMQTKLLQVIQEKEVARIGSLEKKKIDFRLITATNRDIKNLVASGDFREDLYYRLNVVFIEIPPLRKRKQDILPMVNFYLEKYMDKYNKNLSLSGEAEDFLINYSWPGNVRELINLIERVVVISDGGEVCKKELKELSKVTEEINEEDNIAVNKIIPLKEAVVEVEKKILDMAKEKDMSTYQMADLLGVNQSTIVRKLNKYFSDN